VLSAVLSAAGIQALVQVATPQSSEVVPDYSDAGSMYPSIDHETEPPVPD
jgi:hypothetical protein